MWFTANCILVTNRKIVNKTLFVGLDNEKLYEGFTEFDCYNKHLAFESARSITARVIE